MVKPKQMAKRNPHKPQHKGRVRIDPRMKARFRALVPKAQPQGEKAGQRDRV
jgi:hypothetical protein